MSGYKKIPTSAEVFAVIQARHKDELVLFGSFSDPDGTAFGGAGMRGQMDTSYGIEGTDYPIIEISSSFDIVDGKRMTQGHKSEYWLCIADRIDE